QVLLHDSDDLPAADDFVLRADTQEFLIDQRDLVPVTIVERQFVPEAEDPAVDMERLVSVGVRDGEVVAPRQYSLAQQITHVTRSFSTVKTRLAARRSSSTYAGR